MPSAPAKNLPQDFVRLGSSGRANYVTTTKPRWEKVPEDFRPARRVQDKGEAFLDAIQQPLDRFLDGTEILEDSAFPGFVGNDGLVYPTYQEVFRANALWQRLKTQKERLEHIQNQKQSRYMAADGTTYTSKAARERRNEELALQAAIRMRTKVAAPKGGGNKSKGKKKK